MMMDIKFRGQRANGQWLYGDLTHEGDNFSPCIRMLGGKHAYEVNPESVGQFTGYYDKYSMRLYEGDRVIKDGNIGIVKRNNIMGYQFVVEFDTLYLTLANSCELELIEEDIWGKKQITNEDDIKIMSGNRN